MSAPAIEIVPVSGPLNFLAFCKLPRIIYGDQKQFVPPLDVDRWGLFSRKFNPHFRRVNSQLWLARKNGKLAGRIFAQLYDAACRPRAASHAQFGCLDAIDDDDVVAALTQTAEEWLRQHGATKVQGPFSPSINNESGLLVAGFDELSMIAVPWHPAYLGACLERQGYAKVRDLISYRYDVSEIDKAAASGIIARPQWRKRINLREIDIKHLKQEAKTIVEIFNDAWSENWGFVPFTLEEFVADTEALKLVAPSSRGFMKGGVMVEVDGMPQAFALFLPNLHEIMGDLQGRLFPFGLVRLIARVRRHGYKSGRLALLGIRGAMQGKMAAGVVILAIIAELRRRSQVTPLQRAEFGWVLEDNFGMRRPIELAGGRVYKVHRIYEKNLAA